MGQLWYDSETIMEVCWAKIWLLILIMSFIVSYERTIMYKWNVKPECLSESMKYSMKHTQFSFLTLLILAFTVTIDKVGALG